MGAGKKLWGWYKEGDPPVWLPLQVDENGKVVVDLSAVNINDLGDINITSVADLDLLIYNNATSKWVNITQANLADAIAALTSLSELSDVSIAAVGESHFLIYFTPTSEWINKSPGATAVYLAGLMDLNTLKDLNVPAPADNTFLYWDAATSKWQSSVLAATDIPNLDAAKITTGILAAARVGPKIQDADGDTYLWVEKTADEDKIHGVVKGVETFLIDAAGVLTMVKQSCLKVYRNGDQTITTGTTTTIDFNATEFDVQDEFDIITDHRFTAKTAGKYLIALMIGIASTGANHRFAIFIQKNAYGAGGRTAEVQFQSAWDTYLGLPVLQFLDLAIGDWVEIRLWHDKGSDLTVRGYNHLTYLAITKLS